MLSKLRLLFLCTGNSCRSQMAEGWARHLHGELLVPYSAGVAPSQIDPRAVRVMSEAGVDISGHRSKHLNEVSGVELSWVITVCDHANETCPVFPGSFRRMHVPFEDPPRLSARASSEEQALEPYRRVRDEIRAFIESLPSRFAAAAGERDEGAR